MGLQIKLFILVLQYPTNIAEGYSRNGDVELYHFLQIAISSSNELKYHLLLAHDLNYIKYLEDKSITENLVEVKRMLASFMKKLRADS